MLVACMKKMCVLYCVRDRSNRERMQRDDDTQKYNEKIIRNSTKYTIIHCIVANLEAPGPCLVVGSDSEAVCSCKPNTLRA